MLLLLLHFFMLYILKAISTKLLINQINPKFYDHQYFFPFQLLYVTIFSLSRHNDYKDYLNHFPSKTNGKFFIKNF